MRVGLVVNRQNVHFEGEKPRLDSDGKMRVAGEISVSLHKELFPYVRQLKERYTETQLKYVFRLESSYAQKLYDILKSKAFTGKAWRVAREELYELLAVEKGRLEAFGDFRRFVLERAQREINTHTDIAFDIEYVTKGKRVMELVFHLRAKGGADVVSLPGTIRHTVLKGLMELGLKATEADKIMDTWWETDPERVRWHVAEARKMKASGKARNALAWFRAGLKKDYRPQGSLFGRRGPAGSPAGSKDDARDDTKNAAAGDAQELAAEAAKRRKARTAPAKEPVAMAPVAIDRAMAGVLLRLSENVQLAKADPHRKAGKKT